VAQAFAGGDRTRISRDCLRPVHAATAPHVPRRHTREHPRGQQTSYPALVSQIPEPTAATTTTTTTATLHPPGVPSLPPLPPRPRLRQFRGNPIRHRPRPHRIRNLPAPAHKPRGLPQYDPGLADTAVSNRRKGRRGGRRYRLILDLDLIGLRSTRRPVPLPRSQQLWGFQPVLRVCVREDGV